MHDLSRCIAIWIFQWPSNSFRGNIKVDTTVFFMAELCPWGWKSRCDTGIHFISYTVIWQLSSFLYSLEYVMWWLWVHGCVRLNCLQVISVLLDRWTRVCSCCGTSCHHKTRQLQHLKTENNLCLRCDLRADSAYTANTFYHSQGQLYFAGLNLTWFYCIFVITVLLHDNVLHLFILNVVQVVTYEAIRNFLTLNEDKTRVIWLGTHQQLDKVMVQTLELQNATVPFSSVVDDLGVLLDSELTIIRLRHSADPVSSTCDSSGPSNSQQSTGLLQQSAGCC